MPSRSSRPSHRSRVKKPDEDRDVIVHYVQIHNAATGEKRDTWGVFLGLEKQAEFITFKDATAYARQLARKHRRRAWLHDASGYPLKPIEV